MLCDEFRYTTSCNWAKLALIAPDSASPVRERHFRGPLNSTCRPARAPVLSAEKSVPVIVTSSPFPLVGSLTLRDATINCCLSSMFSAMSCPRDLVKSRNSPTPADKGRLDSCSKRFVLTTKRVSPVRMRSPSVGNTTSWFCSKSGN